MNIQKLFQYHLAMAGVALVLVACSPIAAPPALEPATAPAPQNALAATLGNLTYSGILPDQTLTFTDGVAEYEEEGPGTPYVRLIDNLIATGDLNGDGTEDAVVLLHDFSVGSGDFAFLSAVLNVDTEPTPTPAWMVGDRIQVKSLAIEAGQVVVEAVAQGQSDPACCPSWNVRKVFTLQEGALAESSSEELTQVALADLNGTSWSLRSLGEGQASPLPDVGITLQIDDGQISGSASCNQYNAALTADADQLQSLVVGPIAATRKLCPEPIAAQEDTYLALLASAIGWRYSYGDLAILYRTADNTVAALLFARQETGAQATLPRFEALDECFVAPPDDVMLGVEIDCGYVVVPEFYQGESSRELKLGITRLRSPADTGASPLFMLAGGPGQTQIQAGLYRLFQPELLGNVLAERDVVVVEQRGTFYTETFLDCPAVYSAGWQVIEQKLDAEQALASEHEILQECIDGFRAQGINFDAYNSAENAADVNAVRQALGYERIIYYGASYGAQLGQHIMRDFPAILEAVLLDGANALSRKSWVEDQALDSQWGIDNLTALCAADEKCSAAYDIPQLVELTLELFDSGPLAYTYVDPSDPANSFDLEITQADMVSLIHELQSDRLSTFTLPSILYQIMQGGSDAAREILGQIKATSILAARDATPASMAFLMHLAMVCSDDPVKSVDDVIVEGTGRYATLFGQAAAQEYAMYCAMMDVTELPDSTDINVAVAVPTLLLSGKLDIATPEFRSQTVADALPNAILVSFPGRTHVQIAGINLCAAQVATQFFLSPTAPLDTSCTEEDELLGFVLPDGTMSTE